MAHPDDVRRPWPPRALVIQSPSVGAGSVRGPQEFLSLEYVSDPVTALLDLGHLAPDAVLVPTDAEGMNVPALVRGVRQWAGVPVLVVLGYDVDAAAVAAEAVAVGCDGLLSVPMTTADISARLGDLTTTPHTRARGLLTVAGVTVDLDAMRVVSADGQEAALSSLQFACLVRLARAAPAFLPTDVLADDLGLLGDNVEERTRRVVYRLRQRLIEAGCPGDLLESVRGRGYRLQT